MMGRIGWVIAGGVTLGVAACGSADDRGLRGFGLDGGPTGPDVGPSMGGNGPAAGGASGGGGATGGSSDGGATAGGRGGAGGASAGAGGAGASGGTAGAATGGAGGIAALVPCQNSLDCVSDPLGRVICGAGLGVCVECGTTADCPADNECLGNRCIAFQPCQNSLDCASGTVCDAPRGRCVQCVGTNDCAAGDVCIRARCVTGCDSDNDCTSSGRLCDFASGACAECLGDGECDDAEFCLFGGCVPDVCPAGNSVCTSGGVSRCSARGDTVLPVASCGPRQACVDGTSGASCTPWVCTAGATECADPTTAIVCAADGLSVESTTDCSATSEVCNAGACSDLACSPDADYCEQGTVRRCASDGLGSTLVDTCGQAEFCDAADATCKPLLCSPGAPACNGSVATTCDGSGTGYVAGGTDCATTAQTCAAGTCQTCPGGLGPLEDVRLAEVFVGQADYVILRNTNPTCPVDVSGLTLTAADTDATYNLTISSYMLDPGAEVLVAESGTTAPVTSDLIDLNYTAGHVMLCVGSCATGASPTVIDAMSYWNGATSPPALPSPVTFTPLQGITSTNGTTTAFVRDAYSGTYSSFLASDWTTGPATQPDSASGTCPATQPAGFCTAFGAVCTYGLVTCTCSLSTVWSCG